MGAEICYHGWDSGTPYCRSPHVNSWEHYHIQDYISQGVKSLLRKRAEQGVRRSSKEKSGTNAPTTPRVTTAQPPTQGTESARNEAAARVTM